jgi:hypothetical protein
MPAWRLPVTDQSAVAGPRRMLKAERLLALAREKYEPHRATRWPYLMRGDEQFRFEGPDRRRLMADLRAAWRGEFPGEAAPAARDLGAVVDDLRRLAEQAEPDQLTAEDQAAELMAAYGISAVPADRGLSTWPNHGRLCIPVHICVQMQRPQSDTHVR